MQGWEAVVFPPDVCQHIPGCVWLGELPVFSSCARETSARVGQMSSWPWPAAFHGLAPSLAAGGAEGMDERPFLFKSPFDLFSWDWGPGSLKAAGLTVQMRCWSKPQALSLQMVFIG